MWGLAACLFWATGALAAPVEVPGFVVAEAMIPMRDGIKLHTVIYTPVECPGTAADPVPADSL